MCAAVTWRTRDALFLGCMPPACPALQVVSVSCPFIQTKWMKAAQCWRMYQGAASGGGTPVLEGAPSRGRGSRGGRGGGASAGARKGAKSGYPTLGDLVEAGVVVPGKSNISVVYKGVTYVASLNKDGLILYQGRFSGC